MTESAHPRRDRSEAGLVTAVTAWPRAALPVPLVFRPRIRDIDGDVLVLETPSQSVGDVRAVPEELFLRELLDVDLADPTSIAHFTSEYGLLLYSRARQIGNHGAEQRFWSPQRDLQEIRRALIAELRDRSAGRDGSPRSALAGDRKALPIVTLLRSVQAQLAGRYPADSITLHIDDFRLLATEYRDLVRIWLDFALNTDDHRAAWESPLQVPDDPGAFLGSRLAPDLRRFAPRVVATGSGAGASDLDRTWSLNAALAVQLYNDIAETPAYRRCSLEDCRRVFARARGRSEQGRHRSDAKYCSKSCADLAMKRRQRARKSPASR